MLFFSETHTCSSEDLAPQQQYHQLRGLENRRHVIKMRRNLNAAVVKVAL